MTELYRLALEGRMYNSIATWLGIISLIGFFAFTGTLLSALDNCSWYHTSMSPRKVKIFWVTGIMLLLCVAGTIYCSAMVAARPSIEEAKTGIQKDTNSNSNKN